MSCFDVFYLFFLHLESVVYMINIYLMLFTYIKKACNISNNIFETRTQKATVMFLVFFLQIQKKNYQVEPIFFSKKNLKYLLKCNFSTAKIKKSKRFLTFLLKKLRIRTDTNSIRLSVRKLWSWFGWRSGSKEREKKERERRIKVVVYSKP